MNCPNCNAENDNDNIFCVSCGGNLTPPTRLGAISESAPTQFYNPRQMNLTDDSPESVQTAFKTKEPFVAPTTNFDPAISYQPAQNNPPKSNKILWVGLGMLFLLIGGGIGGFFLFKKQPAETSEKLPDHLGMFVRNTDDNLTEISRQDFSNAMQAKDDLSKNESLPATDEKSNLLLYSDGKDVPINDLKLVQIDSIKDDGSLKQLNFQVAPIEGKPDIKRLRVPDGLANGKYAFALLDGFLDEGKHKFWAFQVKNAQKNDNGDLAKSISVSMKPKIASTPSTNSSIDANSQIKTLPAPKPASSAPAGAQVAYCKSNNIVVRNSPELNAKKINALKRGQKIYIINYSDNYDYWNGMEGNWAYIQTESGSRGWVFSPLIGGE